jgi:hypothetical protein
LKDYDNINSIPVLDLTDSSAGSLTLTNTGSVKPGSVYIHKASDSGSFGLCYDGDVGPSMQFRNCRVNQNTGENININRNSSFIGAVVLD